MRQKITSSRGKVSKEYIIKKQTREDKYKTRALVYPESVNTSKIWSN
jgi:hypothetical protein